MSRVSLYLCPNRSPHHLTGNQAFEPTRTPLKEEYYAVEDQRFLGAEGFGERLLKKEPDLSGKTLTRRPIETAARELAKLFENRSPVAA
jgi:hypothetical protein